MDPRKNEVVYSVGVCHLHYFQQLPPQMKGLLSAMEANGASNFAVVIKGAELKVTNTHRQRHVGGRAAFSRRALDYD